MGSTCTSGSRSSTARSLWNSRAWRLLSSPTTRNRQGWDFGNQYRSAIFFADDAQEAAARTSLAAEQANRKRKIVTQIVAAEHFWPAEDYHQQYLEKRGQASCAVSVGAA